MTTFFRKFSIFLFILSLIFPIFGRQSLDSNLENQSVNIGFKISEPELENIDSSYLLKLDDYIKKNHQSITSFLIIKNGSLVWERYYINTERNDLHEVHSITKAFVSAATGIAIKKKYIEGVNQKIVDFFPEYRKNIGDPYFNEITVEHLLTMTSGIHWESIDKNVFSIINKIKYDMDPYGRIKNIFEYNGLEKPGTTFLYHSNSIRFLSGIIAKQSNMTDLEFIKKYLFKELDITEFAWPQDINGLNVGGKDLFLKPIDMAKLGQVYLDNGMWNGSQIIPEHWIKVSTEAHVKTKTLIYEKKPIENIGFGYSWWVSNTGGNDMFFSFGKWGQYIIIVPDLRIVVVMTSLEKPESESYRHLVDDYIIPSIIQ